VSTTGVCIASRNGNVSSASTSGCSGERITRLKTPSTGDAFDAVRYRIDSINSATP
jgi:hypothetical protein